VPEQRDLTSEVAAASPGPKAVEEPERPAESDTPEKTATKSSTPKKTASTSSSSSSSSDSSERHRPGAFRRVGGHLQKFFTGKNTIGR
jgi:hypothetical protein